MMSQLLTSILTEYLCRTTATQSMKHKIGINPFILPTLLNQRIILLIHQPDGFVYKLICTHIFIEICILFLFVVIKIFFLIEYTKNQTYRKYKSTSQPVNIIKSLV